MIKNIKIPKFFRFLFYDTRASAIWLIARLYIGYIWIAAGIEKIQNPVWAGEGAGGAIKGFVSSAIAKSTGEHPAVQSWYASFLENIVLPIPSFWSHLIAYGEFLVGVGLILGAFTGITVFFAILMNYSFLLAGSVGQNPIMLLISLFILLAWRVAGHWGLDYYLLSKLGTPWQKGTWFNKKP